AMRWALAILTCCLSLTPAARADEPLSPDGTPIKNLRGIVIMRQGDQTTTSVGGGLFRRRVKVVTDTPEGPVVTRFTLPSDLCGPNPLVLPPSSAPAVVRVEIPDKYGQLFIEGELVPTRLLESPPLSPGKAYPVRLRAVFQAGDKLLIEDKVVLIRAGESAAVTFDGRGALA